MEKHLVMYFAIKLITLLQKSLLVMES
uniref:Truncated ribosomal protein L16 n=1 Tax=Pseudolarix amabilis TaxID=3355 RepID=D2DWI1_PSEAD|nr:truncated ribosomal protein L16 [Pseudolarix amabilis]